MSLLTNFCCEGGKWRDDFLRPGIFLDHMPFSLDGYESMIYVTWTLILDKI